MHRRGEQCAEQQGAFDLRAAEISPQQIGRAHAADRHKAGAWEMQEVLKAKAEGNTLRGPQGNRSLAVSPWAAINQRHPE